MNKGDNDGGTTIIMQNPAPQPQPAHQPQPAYGQPAYGQPAYGQSAYGQPAYGQPGYMASPVMWNDSQSLIKLKFKYKWSSQGIIEHHLYFYGLSSLILYNGDWIFDSLPVPGAILSESFKFSYGFITFPKFWESWSNYTDFPSI